MPFKSKAQIIKFQKLVEKGEITVAQYREWMRATPHPEKLPDRVGPKRSKGHK